MVSRESDPLHRGMNGLFHGMTTGTTAHTGDVTAALFASGVTYGKSGNDAVPSDDDAHQRQTPAGERGGPRRGRPAVRMADGPRKRTRRSLVFYGGKVPGAWKSDAPGCGFPWKCPWWCVTRSAAPRCTWTCGTSPGKRGTESLRTSGVR